jgi:hypothetical protein
MKADEKQKVANDFARFVEAVDFDYDNCQKLFTKRLYEHLHLHCGFIAHYDQNGFFGTYFENPEDTIGFFKELQQGIGYCGEYEDLDSAMKEAISNHKGAISMKMDCRELHEDKLRIWALMKKHNLEVVSISELKQEFKTDNQVTLSDF